MWHWVRRGKVSRATRLMFGAMHSLYMHSPSSWSWWSSAPKIGVGSGRHAARSGSKRAIILSGPCQVRWGRVRVLEAEFSWQRPVDCVGG